jgi:hypothetical protein
MGNWSPPTGQDRVKAMRCGRGEVRVVTDDEMLGGGDAEQESDVRRARIARELIAVVRGLPPAEVPELCAEPAWDCCL